MRTSALMAVLLAVVIGQGVAGATPQAAAEGPASGLSTHIPRVRANESPSMAALVAEGAARSATFRQVLAAVDATDGIVYVEPGTCRHGVRACLMHTVTVAGPSRILRIAVDPHRDHDELLAAIGHELQHALEALSDPHVTNYHKMYSLFDRIGATGSERFETVAAERVSVDVMAELHTTARNRTGERQTRAVGTDARCGRCASALIAP